MTSEWCPSDSQMTPDWYPSHPQMTHEWLPCHACMTCTHVMHACHACMPCMHVMHAWHASCMQVISKTRKNKKERKKLSPEARKQTRASESLKMELKTKNLTKGGAQKVSPGGAKTNESFWKSQNNIKNTILRFPSCLFTIALVIERKKLSPEARKQTRAFESLKMSSTNQLNVSHRNKSKRKSAKS